MSVSGLGEGPLPADMDLDVAPLDHPRIAVACIIEHAGHGGSTAAPAVKAVLQKYFELNPPQGGVLVKNPDSEHYEVDPLAD